VGYILHINDCVLISAGMMGRLTSLKCFSTIKQTLSPKDIYSAIKPLFYFSKMIGLAPFTYTSTTRRKSESGIEISTFGTMHSYTMLCLLMVFIIIVFKWNVENVFSEYNFMIGIILICDSCFFSFSVMTSYAVCATINRCKVIKFLSIVAKVDAWLIKSDNSYKKLFLSLCLSVTVHVVINLVCYIVGFRIPHVKSNHINLIYFVFVFVSEVAMLHFICSIMLLKDRFEILNKELLSVFGAVEELTFDERVVHTQSRKLSTDTGLSTEITTEAPSRHNTTAERLDFSTLDAQFSNLSSDEASNKIVQILRLRGIYNMLCDMLWAFCGFSKPR